MLLRRPTPRLLTHWTGTVVDCAYAKGEMRLDGVLVAPSELSDHRPVICDWEVLPQTARGWQAAFTE